MNLSGILVVVPPEHLKFSIDALNALPGIDVHHQDPTTGRIVVTQEAETTDAEMEGLRRIKALPNIILAEMVYHRFDDGAAENVMPAPEGPGEDRNSRVPPFLNE
jgi:nitrate reductase NapD